MKRLLIVDFNAVLHRVRNALLRGGNRFTTSDGTPVTGVFSFINNITAVVRTVDPTHVVIAYDAGSNTRKKESTTYKANRPALSDDFKIEMGILLDEALYAMGLEPVGLRGHEADDIIYTFAHVSNFGSERMDEVVILTCDHDLLQCVNERTKVLLFNSAKKQVLMGVDEVLERWGCYPDDIRFIKAISGDSSDNISGVKGVGPKTALKIMEESQWMLDVAFKHKKLQGHEDEIKDNLELVTLRNIIGEIGPITWSDFELGLGLESDMAAFVEKYEFTSLQKRLKSIVKTLDLK